MTKKRMFSIDRKSNAVLEQKKKQSTDSSLSKFVNESIINNSVPTYVIELRTVALYLLDLISGEDLPNGKLQTSDCSYVLQTTISTTMMWLSEHRIEKFKPIKDLFDAAAYDLSYDYRRWCIDWDKKEMYLNFTQVVMNDTSEKTRSDVDLFRVVEALAKIEAEYISELIIRAKRAIYD